MALAEANPRGGGSPLVGSHNVYLNFNHMPWKGF